MAKQSINIVYKVIGRVDGRWTIQAFDKKGKPISVSIAVNTATEAWKMFFMLNGMGCPEEVVEDEITEVIYENALKAS